MATTTPSRDIKPSPLTSALSTLSSALNSVQAELGLNGALAVQRENDELRQKVHELEEKLERLEMFKAHASVGSLSPTGSPTLSPGRSSIDDKMIEEGEASLCRCRGASSEHG